MRTREDKMASQRKP